MATSRISEVKSSRDAASAHAELRNTFDGLAEIHAAAVPGLAQQLEGRVHELAVAEAEVVQDLLRGHLRTALMDVRWPRVAGRRARAAPSSFTSMASK